MQYDFEWDPNKARQNVRKHGVTFENAATVFRDPRARSIFDDVHSVDEDRWITLGLAASGGMLVVHHTFQQFDDARVRIRIFSSRQATKQEMTQYME